MYKINSKQLNDHLKKLADKHPTSQWDLGAGYSTETSAQVDKGDVRQMQSTQRIFATLRVWNSQKLVGVASTSDLSENGLERAFKGALEASHFSQPAYSTNFSPLATAPIRTLKIPITEASETIYLLDTLRQAEIDLLRRHKAITSVPSNCITERMSEVIYFNSEGALRHHNQTAAVIYLSARSEQIGRKPRGGDAYRQGLRITDLDIDSCIDEAVERTISHLDYKSIKSGHYITCFSPGAFLNLMMAFSNIFNARSVLDGVSISRPESLGQPLTVPFLSIYDHGLHPSMMITSPFDGEGTPIQKVLLVEGGILRNFVHSESTARQFGVAPTGHAGMSAKVSVGVDMLEIVAVPEAGRGDATLHHQTSDNFIWVDSLSALHSGVKASQGLFSLPFDGWLVKGGEKHSIDSAVITGDICTFLNSIIAIEELPVVTPEGICPYIWIEGMSIIGEA
uniref:Putative modulator of DNA gyrase n=1 Tax=Paulinella micropora TaxID=1928728 RepID=A0A385I1E1_9EUKA|nr:putative modulator of DNA gyrase [Paulinella micropora]AXY63749.1 putative modulator of DNA gyrase [Paulinella micropora]